MTETTTEFAEHGEAGEDTSEDTSSKRAARYHGTPEPSDAYAGCLTTEAIGARYKQLFQQLADERHEGNVFRVTLAETLELGEDYRRAQVRAIVHSVQQGTTATGRRRVVEKVAPPEDPDQLADWVIVCTDCGEPLPATKFPTVGPKMPGYRESRCRDCRTAAKAQGES